MITIERGSRMGGQPGQGDGEGEGPDRDPGPPPAPAARLPAPAGPGRDPRLARFARRRLPGRARAPRRAAWRCSSTS